MRSVRATPSRLSRTGVEDIFTQDYQDTSRTIRHDIVELIGGTTVARDIVVGALKAARTWSRPTRRFKRGNVREEVMGAADDSRAGRDRA